VLIGEALRSVAVVGEVPHLLLWHGLNLALAMSAAALLGGTVLIRVLGTAHLPAIWPNPPEGTFTKGIDLLGDMARRMSSVTQSGSLPIYLATILTVVVVVPGIPLVAAAVVQGAVPTSAWGLGDTMLGLAIAAAAVVTARSNRRFSAVLSLGAVGFGIALVFVRWGAPDLALTQMVVETLALMLFVLALRDLPRHFGPDPALLSTAMRWMLAAGMGSLVTTFALVGSAARTATPPAAELAELAEPVGGGKNIVNVILTDIRAMDTLGELAVLLIAAIGITVLVTTGRDTGPSLPESDVHMRRDADLEPEEPRRATVGGPQ
jgi:multicomponent Na+:H+ antiporter subunit A